ncbi:hypothetical protein [Brevibacillus reuszeri]|uniref:hypothetical protein n=1 Tax=unclassified Brevibacillus TaxID=2684853 RepID=UPI0027961CE9|nr:hypothetical protein [Brevibacillus reuszeri]
MIVALPAEKRPVYDDRVKEIQRMLTEGKTREHVAKELGYSSVSSMHTVMNRKNFMWDKQKGNYVPTFTRVGERESIPVMDSSKAGQVVALFAKEEADAKVIAKRLGFGDHRELATYMTTKGYVWNAEQNNYIKMVGEIKEESESFAAEKMKDKLMSEMPIPSPTKGNLPAEEGMAKYMPLLEMLDRNKDKLVDLLVPGSETGKIPRYVVPGVAKTKTVHMMNMLEQLVVDFNREKNISQREIFEVALIEFFRKYGYEREVEQLLGQR